MSDKIFTTKFALFSILLIFLNLSLFANVFLLKNYSSTKVGLLTALAVLVFSLVLVHRVYVGANNQRTINTLIEKIAEVYEQLAIMEKQRTEFISIASHQLRTPLTVIKGYASMILEGTFGAVSDQARGALNSLYRSSEKIVELVDELLVVSRIEEGRTALSLKAVNFSKFIQDVLSVAESKVKEAGLELLFSIEEEGKEALVDIDESRIKSVILHLLDNATEFTKAPGAIRVVIAVDTVAKKVVLSVSDTGIGMTTEQIKALFERFDLKISVTGEISARGVPETEKEARSKEKEQEFSSGGKARGMGIYVAKEIIHAHHGYFMAESDGVNMGTTFIIELPMINSAI